jgi:anti-sigma B factor antagonist
MDLRVSSRSTGDRVVLALDGIADLASAPHLHGRLRAAIDRAPGTVVTVDVDGLIALDDVVLGLLLGAAAHARERGGDLEIVCTAERLRERLAHTRFDRAVSVRDSIEHR